MESRRSGEGPTVRYAIVHSYLGWVLIASTDRGICRIAFGDEPEFLKYLLKMDFPRAQLLENDQSYKKTVEYTLSFIDDPKEKFSLPLDLRGTPFQQRVWNALKKIPPGSTVSYAEIAKQIGKQKAARAVASACAANKIAVVVPCHRVVRSNGDPGGYRWGLERKRKLIERESKTQNR